MLDLGPLSLWKVDLTSGTNVADSVGAIAGTIIGTALYNQGVLVPDAYDCQSIKFQNAVGTRIDVGDVYNFTGSAHFSFVCWCKATTYNSVSGHNIADSSDASARGWNFRIVNPACTLQIQRGDAAGFDTVFQVLPQSEYENGMIKLLGMIYDGTNLIIGYNGVYIKSGASSKSLVAATTDLPLSFGGANVGGASFDGQIGFIAIYDYDLTEAEFASIWDAQTGVDPDYSSLKNGRLVTEL